MSDGSYRRRCYVYFSYTCLFTPGNKVFPSQHSKNCTRAPRTHRQGLHSFASPLQGSHLNPQYLFLGGGHPVGDVCLSLCILPLFFPIDFNPPYAVIFLQHKAITLREKPSKGLSLTNKETLGSWAWRWIDSLFPVSPPLFWPGHAFLSARLSIPHEDAENQWPHFRQCRIHQEA